MSEIITFLIRWPNSVCHYIGIDLSECTDCDWSIIESVAYAKAARSESINILETLKLRNELSADIAAFHTVRIRAAEKIMADMNQNFEQYQSPAEEWLISSTV